MTRKKQVLAGGISLVLFFMTLAGAGAENFSSYVDEDGSISKPQDFRTDWTHLGSWIVPSENDKQYGFHDVYARQATVEAYQRTGQFPDGAAVIREIRSVETSTLSSGQTSWAGDVESWYLMIKDQEGRFEDHPAWGQGWGWARFMPDDSGQNLVEDYRQDCLGCHVPAQKTDFVNIQGYPTLR